MRNFIRNLATVGCAAMLAMIAAPAAAEEDGHVTYIIQANDTLYGIKERFLVSDADVFELRDYNRVRNTRALRINSTLLIPRKMLDYTPIELRVFRQSGPVSIEGGDAFDGQVLNEGERIVTRRNGFVTLMTNDGKRISLPSNTTARLIRARRYTLGETIDIDFEVESGRARARSPRLNEEDRLRMRTPLAVTAVRGTEFRVAYDPQSGESSLTEVTEGVVNVSAGNDQIDAASGFGIASTAAGVSEPLPLLPAPEFVDGGAIQTGEALEFTIEPVTGATGYRVQLAKEAGFLDVIAEELVEGTQATVTDIENGSYFVRARAISQSGLEGETAATPFRRKQLGIAAEEPEGSIDEGYRFAWIGNGEGENMFAFQMWEAGNPQTLLIDEVGFSETEFVLTDLDRGQYQWRVAIAQADEEEGLLKIWGETQTLNITE